MTTATTTSPAPAPPRSLLGRVALAVSDIKIAHSVFALPFAVLASFLTAQKEETQTIGGPQYGAIIWPHFFGQLALVVLCMVLARTWAMLVNRLADHRFDAGNPRTARRVFASGRLDTRSGWTIALGCAALFQLAATGFWIFFNNPWPTYLAIPVLGWIALYSFTKRFTWLCHFFLGGALAASPLAAAIAINPGALFDPANGAFYSYGPELNPFTLLALSSFVLFWVAGFDVAYALQDIDFDRKTGLHSIPAKLGTQGALYTSRVLHTLAFASLCIAFSFSKQLGGLFASAISIVGVVLVFEHIVLARRGVAGLPLAFFTLNGIVSILLGAVGCIEIARAA